MSEASRSRAAKARKSKRPGAPAAAARKDETAKDVAGELPLHVGQVREQGFAARRASIEDATPSRDADSVAPALAGVAIAAWTVFFLWANWGALAGGAGAGEWSSLIVDWSVPVLLVIAIWLLALRHSRSQASSESTALEHRLESIDRELSLARETKGSHRLDQSGEPGTGHSTAPQVDVTAAFAGLDAQTADLDQLVQDRFERLRQASERFAVELEAREQDNLSAIRRRADEMAKALSTEDIAMRNRAGQAMDELQARFKAVRDESLRLSGELEKVQADALRGWDRAVAELETRMEETVGKVVEVDESALENARTRLAALHEEAERIDAAASERLKAFHAEIAKRRDAAFAGGGEALAGLEQQVAEFDRRLDQRRKAALSGGDEALAGLEQQLAEFDSRLDERRKAQLARIAELGKRSEALAARMAEVDGQLAGHVEQFEAASNALGSFAGDLTRRLTESRDLLNSSGKSLNEMTEASTRLFELIRSSADYSAETIPAALTQAQDKLSQFEARTNSLRDAIVAAEEKGAALVSHLDRAREGVPVSSETLDALGKRLEDVAAQSDALAQRTRKDLAGAIAELENSTKRMGERLREGQEAALNEFAATFGERSLEIVGKGLREKTEAAIAELERAAQGASRAGLETVGQLRTQLAEVQEMAGNLEARVAQAREQAQVEPTKDFSIEVTKITERLRSAAIDITKVFDAEVPDTAWQAYMRGDYGTFTRKAVKLMSDLKADAVYGHYQSDENFRETVNRYVHDFESMLRVVLSTRNGHSMAVTLLSSDVGKLYVALAQATERLRG